MKPWLLGCAFLLAASAASAQAPPNDTCAGAIEFMCGENVNLQTNTIEANNDYDQAAACTPFTSNGPDIVYKIVIPSGGSVAFTLDTSPPNGSGVDASLYLITDCANPSGSCLVGDDECNALTDVEEISYTNNTAAAQTTYLIVDGFVPGPGEVSCGAPGGIGLLTGTVTCPTGACCFPYYGIPCTVTTQADCQSDPGNTYQGDGTTCSPDPCPPQGACCYNNGNNCDETTSAYCDSAFDGTWQGAGTPCFPNPCPGPPRGACCPQDRPGCGVLTQSDCNSIPSTYYMGDGTDCEDGCPTLCCYSDGRCNNRTEPACAEAGGLWRGSEEFCTPGPICPQPTGACCMPDGSCIFTYVEYCQAYSGYYVGDGIDCASTQCVIAVQPTTWGRIKNTYKDPD